MGKNAPTVVLGEASWRFSSCAHKSTSAEEKV
jgi:hypothetical protein